MKPLSPSSGRRKYSIPPGPSPSVRLPITLHDDRLEKLAKALDDALLGYLEWAEEDDAESLMLLL